jgi:hypothetical protein
LKIDFSQSSSISGDPLIAEEYRKMYRTAEMMGLDTSDPELMGAFFSALQKKIKAGISGIKKAVSGGGKPKAVTVQTEKGIISLTPESATWTDAVKPDSSSSSVMPSGSVQTALSSITKNPVALAAIIGIPLLLMMKGKR